MVNDWTEKRRARQSNLIHQWRPWEKSTGPKTPKGKCRISLNAFKGGTRPILRKLAQVLRRIRPDIPIILCTGFSRTMNAAKAQALGIDAFLMKPLALRDLAATIQQVLARAVE